MNNIYKPYLMTVSEIIEETYDTKTLKLVFSAEPTGSGGQDKSVADAFDFKAGQFGLYSAFGDGEATFCIASSPTRKGYIECCFRKTGRVTKALFDVEVGDTIGFRGPYGNYFPLDMFEGKNIIFIAGGIGLAPIRSVIWNCLDLLKRFGKITIIYGARTVSDLVYKRELPEWSKYPNTIVVQTVDPGGETKDWTGKIGLVPKILEETHPDSTNAVALICGPPIMIKFTLPVLDKLGFTADNIYTTLENRMKCGVGKCGRCNV
ncbi:MAG: FAD/NAD(P)-binding protein, partial [Planctomycetota bacterium]|nr:FAD/NAD(P)-binding protein [Planctomycetota bacterium]